MGQLSAELKVNDVAACYQQPNVLVVDVREPSEFASGHIPAAVLIPLGQLPQRWAELPKDKTIIFVCRSGGRSGNALRLAQAHGVPDVHHMAGGMLAWMASRKPVEK